MRALKVAGYVVLVLVLHALFWKLVHLGLLPVVLTLAGVTAAWLGHTARSRQLADDFFAAIRAEGLTDLQAAQEMGESSAHVSEAKAGTRSLPMWKAAQLPDGVWVAFATRLLTRLGYVVIERGPLADLVEAVRQTAPERRREVA